VSVLRRTFCNLCSLACPFDVEVERREPVGLEYAADDPLTGGALCARGNLAFELLRLPGRLAEPEIGSRPARWPEELGRLAEEIERLPAGSVGLVLSADASAEEARLAGLFARAALGGAPAAVAYGGNEPRVLAEAAAGPEVPELEPEELGRFRTVLAVGDVIALAPVLARRLPLGGRAAGGRTLVYLGPDAGLTRLSAPVRALAPERRAALAVLARLAPGTAGGRAPEVPGAEAAAAALSAGGDVAVVAGSADPVAVRLARLIAAALRPRAAFLCMVEAASARDALAAWRPESDLAGLAAAVRAGRLKGLIDLGADTVGRGALSAGEFRGLQLAAAAAPFASATTAAAGFVLPAALWAERSGTMAGVRREAALPAPGGARGWTEILAGLAAELGAELEGRPAAGLPAALAAEECLRLAAAEDGPTAPWTERESSDPFLRAALAGVLVT
jgi:anaerobic selenocysteine-containing dehydrogenase